jgi:hypothetical protein
LRASGIENANITPELNLQELATPDDWWTIVLGTGYRSTIEQLDPAARERVRIANLESLAIFNRSKSTRFTQWQRSRVTSESSEAVKDSWDSARPAF